MYMLLVEVFATSTNIFYQEKPLILSCSANIGCVHILEDVPISSDCCTKEVWKPF